jgi:FtsP/CotA-like multicopper oxidase with cupredoxin domain
MWGYSCGAATSGSATCAPLNPAAAGSPGVWSPVVITVPTTATGGLQINLTNNLPTPPSATTGIPTSIIIVGQIGGGLGKQRTTTASPDHSGQGVTWPTANTGPTFPPPAQPNRVQSLATEVATGATTPLTWTSLRPGTYLFESGTHQSIQATMGLYGVLVVTSAPAGSTAGTAYPAVGSNSAVTYNSELSLALGEIDPVQNNAVNTAGFSETKVWSGQPGGCGDPASPVGVVNTCYPPVVNYTPLYYTINGVAFSRTNASASLFASSNGTTATPVTGNVLVRLVNAGSRMHVPSIVDSTTGTPAKNGFALVAEDGNPVSFMPHVQSEIFMAAGKTFDALINVPAAGGTALPIFDRELSLSANKINRDAGMLAYIGVNGAGLPAATGLGQRLRIRIHITRSFRARRSRYRIRARELLPTT